MSESLGKSVLDLEANLAPFEKDMRTAKATADDMQHALDAVAAVSKIAEDALKRVKMTPGQGAESRSSASSILTGVRGISEEARKAARDLDDVKLDSTNASETTASGDVIDRKLKDITGNANEARRSLESVRLAGAAAAGAGNPGVGVGPFGSGFGRVGVLGAAIGAGVLTGPAAGPALVGLLGAIPALAGAGAGSLGVLALAFQGVGKAIGGDKKAFDELGPSAQKFTLTIRSLDKWFEKLKQTAAGSLFPGLTDALHSALSPGTLSAVTSAVQQFGNALGVAGMQWGRYFGSAEFQSLFGPLMASGAHSVTVLSAALLQMFDALGVLGRAAIPFTTWLTGAIERGGRFVDTWLHAKDATGELGHAMDEARTSLTLVAQLAGALTHAVVSLGQALYPVSKIAVKDLIDGLNWLAAMFDRNRQTIRDIVGGALAALVSTLKIAVPIVAKLADALIAVVHAIGGWKTAFELVIGGFLALKFLGLAQSIFKVETTAAAATTEMGGLRLALLSLGAPEVLATLAAVAAALALIHDYRTKNDLGASQGQGGQAGRVVEQNGKYYLVSAQNAGRGGPGGMREISKKQAEALLGVTATSVNASDQKGGARRIGGVVRGPGDFVDESPAFKLALSNLAKRYGDVNLFSGFRDEKKQTGLWDASVKAGRPGFMANGNPIARPKSRGGTGSPHTAGVAGDGTIFYNGKWIPLSALPPAILAAYGLETVPGDVNHVQLIGGGAAPTSPFGMQPDWTKNLGTKPPGPPTGANLLPEALRNALQAAKDKATTSQGATAAVWLRVELDDLDKARKNLEGQLKGATGKHKAAIEAELRSIDGQIASVNRQITVNLHAQAQTIKTAFAAKISTAKANIGTAIDALKSSLDVALGARFFQGGARTPLEQQLADMQTADTAKSLQDALAQAIASGDPAQVDAANRAITENNLASAAAAERAKADKDYADAQKDLNLQITMWARGIATGATKLGDLNGIVAAFGLTLTDGGVIDDFATLQAAVQDLAAVLIAEAQALGGVRDNKDAAAAAARAAALSIPTGAPKLIPGTNIDYAGFVAASLARNLPSLDVGGTVMETGLALVHRGETFSGVGPNRMGSDIVIPVILDGREVARITKPYSDQIITAR